MSGIDGNPARVMRGLLEDERVRAWLAERLGLAEFVVDEEALAEFERHCDEVVYAEEITSEQVVLGENHPEAGQVYTVTCPECRQEVACAPFGWSPQVCKCGYHWSGLKITAVGTRAKKSR